MFLLIMAFSRGMSFSLHFIRALLIVHISRVSPLIWVKNLNVSLSGAPNDDIVQNHLIIVERIIVFKPYGRFSDIFIP